QEYDRVYGPGRPRASVLVKESRLASDTTKIKQPLIVINGDPMPGLKMADLDKMLSPNDIVSMSILNADTAIKKYGDIGKNGTIKIKAKKLTRVTQKNETIKELRVDNTFVQDDDNKVFEKVEVEASFRGCYQEWKNYLERNLDKNIPVKNGCKPGTYTVVVRFIVAKDGSVSDVKALTNHGFGMEEEAMRMIRKGPDWVPAIQNGHNVKAYRKQPFTFVIVDPKISISRYSDAPIYAYLINSNEGTTINLADLKKVNQLKLQKKDLVQNCELVSFKITIAKPNPGNEIKKVKDFVIIGNSFSSELLKAIDDLDSETIIILEDIKVKVDNSIKKLPPRIYEVNSIT